MTAETLAAAILRDVPRYRHTYSLTIMPSEDGEYASYADVLAALSRALGGDDLVERAGAVAWDETYDTMMEVERNPTGAFQAIQSQAALIAALLARNAALTVERDAARKWAAEQHACADRYAARAEAAEAEVARLRGAVWLKVGECLAGMTHAEVSPAARRMIEKAIRAALTTEDHHE